MKKNSFDLTGKLIDCTGVSEVVFDTLKQACDGSDDHDKGQFENLKTWSCLSLSKDGYTFSLTSRGKSLEILKPIDVLGEPLMKAIELGYTPVFEGDIIPEGEYDSYYGDDESMITIAYKEISDFGPKGITLRVKPNFDEALDNCFKGILPREPCPETSVKLENLIKPNFDELKHFDDDTFKWKEREKETYTDNDEKIESLARDLLVASLSREPITSENYYLKIKSVWQIASEFYKVKS